MGKIKTEIKRVDPKTLTLLEENARYMTHEQFHTLVRNVKRDGCLTSAPFVWFDEESGRSIVLSGNHRTKAALAAGLPEIDVICTSDRLTEEQRIAMQLSHNSITGQDDMAVLAGLYEKILDMELREYSGLDDKTLELLKDVKPVSIGEANLEFQTLALVFLPAELEAAKKVVDDAMKMVKSDAKWFARFSEYDRWLDGLEATGAAYGVKNVATCLKIIFDVFNEHMGDLRPGWDHDKVTKKQFVPMASVLGSDKIPATCARVIAKALDIAVKRDECAANAKWLLIEKVCAEYVDRHQTVG